MTPNIKTKLIYLSSFIGILIAICCFESLEAISIAPGVSHSIRVPGLNAEVLNQETASLAHGIRVQGLKPEVLNLAINAYNSAKATGKGAKDILTIVDYSLPSTARRLWVIDMRTKEVLYHTHVAHGSGSGNNYATKFSNKHGSRMSSLGLFLTTNIYNGRYGNSLNLIGLEDRFNSNAEERRIVFHKAHYVDESIIKKIGRLGRSFGCLALNHKEADKILHTIKGGSLVFCYYPDPKWLSESKFL